MTKKIKLKISARLMRRKLRRNGYTAPKACRFCSNEGQIANLDYKNATLLLSFLTERGKILPSRISGNCSLHQRLMCKTVKMSRTMALLPYCLVRARY